MVIQRILGSGLLCIALIAWCSVSQAWGQLDYLPPWNPPPANGKYFTIPELDIVADLHGDVVDPQLTVFFAGNQFMVVHELVAAFQKRYPQYQRIFVETLPPGILADQIRKGALVMGNLRIALRPDIYTAGQNRIKELQKSDHWFSATENYARNRLALMVYQGNPEHVAGLQDLGRADVRVSMPNPQWEGIAKRIETLYRKAGGEPLVNKIMVIKVKDGSTYLTQIHHRQTPLRILRGESDVGPVWYTEAYFQEHILHNPISTVEISDHDNMEVTYTAGLMKTAPHPQAARDFMRFLTSSAAQAIYRYYGFLAPDSELVVH
ncbi:MAG TPA: substrate-binding domain-containing protein [Gammaproteobacteria bacterium]|nr:substrate-binding domain-containing protein [Gammaproteobacteria bacterium]